MGSGMCMHPLCVHVGVCEKPAGIRVGPQVVRMRLGVHGAVRMDMCLGVLVHVCICVCMYLHSFLCVCVCTCAHTHAHGCALPRAHPALCSERCLWLSQCCTRPSAAPQDVSGALPVAPAKGQ